MNHIYGATYFDNYRVLLYTAFSVTLFTLVSGVTSAIDMERGFEIKTYLVSRIKRVIIPYIIASIICILFQYKLLNINILFKNLIAFSASPPYYFILFYIQLIIVAPYIYIMFQKTQQQKVLQIILLIGAYFTGILFNKYTYIEGTMGGSSHLLGGSYFFAFVFGMWFYLNRNYFSKKIVRVSMGLIGTIGIILMDKLDWIVASWSNPPNKYAVFYTLCIFALIYVIFEGIDNFLKEESEVRKVLKKVFEPGSKSLYVFLYHMIFINILNVVYAKYLHLPSKLINLLFVALGAIYLPVIFYNSYKFIVDKLGKNRDKVRLPKLNVISTLICLSIMILFIYPKEEIYNDYSRVIVYKDKEVIYEEELVELPNTYDEVCVLNNRVNLKDNTLYRIEFNLESGENIPALFYMDLFGEGYDSTNQDMIFNLEMGKNVYSAQVFSDTIPNEVYLRIIFNTNQEYNISNLKLIEMVSE